MPPYELFFPLRQSRWLVGINFDYQPRIFQKRNSDAIKCCEIVNFHERHFQPREYLSKIRMDPNSVTESPGPNNNAFKPRSSFTRSANASSRLNPRH